MTQAIRPSTLETLGLGTVFQVFRRGGMPARAGDLVDQVFGPEPDRGALVVSGANGIVGAGKIMQLGSRLQPYNVPIVALDFPGVPDGIGKQYPGLQRAFGSEQANAILSNVTQLNYDGKKLPEQLAAYKPRFLLESIPEILEIKKQHYAVFRAAFPEIEIRSVTSGFPYSELGVGIAHPAFPHEINKVWETIEPEVSDVTKLLWALGLIPMPVEDNWSFVLDVLFCGLTGAASRYHEASNMPFWKSDKFVRRLLGPNPMRAHDAIGAAGANFLTWSCLHHLGEHYGALFEPTDTLVEHKDAGADWYPMNHFRPLVNWGLEGEEADDFHAWILGPLFQMTALMIHEKRAHLTHMNSIGELCAQFTRGMLAVIRSHGADAAIKTVEAYHELHPEAGEKAWHPEAFKQIESPEWQQLYVNAEHDGEVGVISIARESYNADVDAEMNRAIDWLKAAGVESVIVTGDFHLSTQMVGADTNEFFPAMENAEAGIAISRDWSATARRLNGEFKTSIGFVNGKRALGGMLELLTHCHFLIAVGDADLGFPEVTLPVVPGMEGCHWPFRKADKQHWPELMRLLLEGRPVKARDAAGWLVDYAGSMDESIQTVWRLANGTDGMKRRPLADGKLEGVEKSAPRLKAADTPLIQAGRKAILDCIRDSCGATLAEAIGLQSRHSGNFMTEKACLKGVVGSMYQKTVKI
jgi:enoyl-CoA hydratase/carnithine racemase